MIRWHNAPKGISLEIDIHTETGRTQVARQEKPSQFDEVRFDVSSGEVDVKLTLDAGSNGSVVRSFRMGERDLAVTVDLAGESCTSLEIRVNGAAVAGPAQLYLAHLRPTSPLERLSAMLAVRDGRTRTPVSLEPGSYFYIVSSPALVCGVVEIPEGKDRRVVLDWEGERMALSELFDGTPKYIEFLAVDGVDLRAHLRATDRGVAREFWHDSNTEVAPGEREIFFAEHYRYRVIDR